MPRIYTPTRSNLAPTKPRRIWLLGAGCFVAEFAWGKTLSSIGLDTLAAADSKQKQYLCSAILREGVAGFAVQLVHSLRVAETVDMAMGVFTRQVLEKYPASGIAKILVTEVSPTPELCGTDKPDVSASAKRAIFAVSAILRQGTDGFDIHLLNGWVPGSGADAALNHVLQIASVKFPNYAPVKTLVTDLGPVRSACPVQGPTGSRWKDA